MFDPSLMTNLSEPLRAWLSDNLQDLQLDPQDKRYRLPGAPAPQARPGQAPAASPVEPTGDTGR